MAKKILVIEDDIFLRKIINKKLSRENYTIVEALSGAEGLELVEKEKPDLVLLDLILPEIDGFKVLARMKKDSKTSKIPVIILSNLGRKEEIRKGIKLGAVDYLVKAHLTPEEIVSRVKVVLDKQK